MIKEEVAKRLSIHNRNFEIYNTITENLYAIPDHLLKTLLAIVRYLPDGFPCIDTMSKMTGLSRSSTKRHVRELKNLGIITVKYRTGASSVYNFGSLSRVIAMNPPKTIQDDEVGSPRWTGGEVTAVNPLPPLGEPGVGSPRWTGGRVTQVNPYHIKDHIYYHSEDLVNLSGNENRKLTPEEVAKNLEEVNKMNLEFVHKKQLAKSSQ